MGGNPITVGRLIVALVLLAFGAVVSFWIARCVRGLLERRKRVTAVGASVIAQLLFYFLILTWVVLGLDVLHIPLTTFAFLGGSLALGFGFGAKDIIGNFISGFILMVQRTVKIGDIVDIEGTVGRVALIGMHSTRIHTLNEVDVIIPNSILLGTKITNWTLHEHVLVSTIVVGIAYGSDMGKACQIMEEATHNTEGVLKNRPVQALLDSLGDSAMLFRIYFASSVTEEMQRWVVESRVRCTVVNALTAANVAMPFVQRDVHLDTKGPIEVRLQPPSS